MFATGIKIFDWQSVLDHLIFDDSKVKLQLHILDPLIFAVQRLPWPGLKMSFDCLIEFLIPVANTSTQDVCNI